MSASFLHHDISVTSLGFGTLIFLISCLSCTRVYVGMRVLEELMISCMWWLLLPKGELQKDTTAEPELHCRLESVS
jgi:hypothetical protein